MFGLFKSDPSKKLQKQYDQLLEQGMQAQRNGDMRLFAERTAEANAVLEKIQQAKAKD